MKQLLFAVVFALTGACFAQSEVNTQNKQENKQTTTMTTEDDSFDFEALNAWMEEESVKSDVELAELKAENAELKKEEKIHHDLANTLTVIANRSATALKEQDIE